MDGTLPEGLWREHEIIFSCRHFPEGCLSFHEVHSKCLSQLPSVEHFQNTSQTCRTSLMLIVQNFLQYHECVRLSHQRCPVGFTPHTMIVMPTLCMSKRIPPSLCLPCLSLPFVLEEEMSRCEKLRGVVCSGNNSRS